MPVQMPRHACPGNLAKVQPNVESWCGQQLFKQLCEVYQHLHRFEMLLLGQLMKVANVLQWRNQHVSVAVGIAIEQSNCMLVPPDNEIGFVGCRLI